MHCLQLAESSTKNPFIQSEAEYNSFVPPDSLKLAHNGDTLSVIFQHFDAMDDMGIYSICRP